MSDNRAPDHQSENQSAESASKQGPLKRPPQRKAYTIVGGLTEQELYEYFEMGADLSGEEKNISPANPLPRAEREPPGAPAGTGLSALLASGPQESNKLVEPNSSSNAFLEAAAGELNQASTKNSPAKAASGSPPPPPPGSPRSTGTGLPPRPGTAAPPPVPPPSPRVTYPKGQAPLGPPPMPVSSQVTPQSAATAPAAEPDFPSYMPPPSTVSTYSGLPPAPSSVVTYDGLTPPSGRAFPMDSMAFSAPLIEPDNSDLDTGVRRHDCGELSIGNLKAVAAKPTPSGPGHQAAPKHGKRSIASRLSQFVEEIVQAFKRLFS